MREADVAEVERRVSEVVARSPLVERFGHAHVEPAESDTGPFLRIALPTKDGEPLRWSDVAALLREIEDAISQIDDRFPSVRFPDAA